MARRQTTKRARATAPGDASTAWLNEKSGNHAFETRRLLWCIDEARKILYAVDGPRGVATSDDVAQEVLSRVLSKRPADFARYYRRAVRNAYRSVQRREIRDRTAGQAAVKRRGRAEAKAQAEVERARQLFDERAAHTKLVWVDDRGGARWVHAFANGFGVRYTNLRRALESYELLAELAKYLGKRKRPPRWPPAQNAIVERIHRRGVVSRVLLTLEDVRAAQEAIRRRYPSIGRRGPRPTIDSEVRTSLSDAGVSQAVIARLRREDPVAAAMIEPKSAATGRKATSRHRKGRHNRSAKPAP